MKTTQHYARPLWQRPTLWTLMCDDHHSPHVWESPPEAMPLCVVLMHARRAGWRFDPATAGPERLPRLRCPVCVGRRA